MVAGGSNSSSSSSGQVCRPTGATNHQQQPIDQSDAYDANNLLLAAQLQQFYMANGQAAAMPNSFLNLSAYESGMCGRRSEKCVLGLLYSFNGVSSNWHIFQCSAFDSNAVDNFKFHRNLAEFEIMPFEEIR